MLAGVVVLQLGASLAVIFATKSAGQSEGLESENVTLEGGHGEVQFLASRSVRIATQVADDVFAVGRDVTLDAATTENAILAGYDVVQRGGEVADMIAAAANLNLGGAIADDLVAAARSLRISAEGRIGGDARLAAEAIDMERRIGGSLRAAARRVTVSAEIAGKADLLAERIVIAPGARIAGDLIYRSKQAPEIAERATIGGQARQIESDMPDLRRIGLTILGIALLLGLVSACFGLGLLIRRGLPGQRDIRMAGRIGWTLAGAVVIGLVALIPLLTGLAASLADHMPAQVLVALRCGKDCAPPRLGTLRAHRSRCVRPSGQNLGSAGAAGRRVAYGTSRRRAACGKGRATCSGARPGAAGRDGYLGANPPLERHVRGISLSCRSPY
ncbi:MAG: hypothetical protein HC871_06930 [Rhizobiales bacterium]|nr:hypothetical protein [Hyphomicrobiales bacterium]